MTEEVEITVSLFDETIKTSISKRVLLDMEKLRKNYLAANRSESYIIADEYEKLKEGLKKTCVFNKTC
mgnify:CR=1 FL=1